MKKNIVKVAMFAVVATLFASCATVVPVTATSNPVGSKVGKATELRIVGIPFTEAGIDAAAKEAGIKKISHVEERTQLLWPIIGKRTTVVYGE